MIHFNLFRQSSSYFDFDFNLFFLEFCVFFALEKQDYLFNHYLSWGIVNCFTSRYADNINNNIELINKLVISNESLESFLTKTELSIYLNCFVL